MHRLVATADVVLENYGPGTMERLGCGYEQLAPLNPRLVYLALKGYLAGPYEHRPALDEVVQFQAGLAFMTGPPGQPLRAGASIIDIMGAVFGVVAAQAALRERDTTGKGQRVSSALFESAAFLMSTHMAGMAATGLRGAADAGAARRLGDLRGVQDRRRRAAVHRRHQRPAMGALRRGIRPAGSWPPIRASPPTSMRASERAWLIPALQEVLGSTAAGRGRAALRARQRVLGAGRPAGRPVRRPASAGDRRAARRADLALRRRRRQTVGLPALPIEFGADRAAPRPDAASRRGWASTTAKCWPKPASARPRSRGWPRRARSRRPPDARCRRSLSPFRGRGSG